MSKFIIEESTNNDNRLIDDGIIDYNLSKVPFSQEPPFVSINRVIRGDRKSVV